MNRSRENHIKKLITNNNLRLQLLKEQQALYGPGVNPVVVIEIKVIEETIEKLQEELEDLKKEHPQPIDSLPNDVDKKSTSESSEIKGIEIPQVYQKDKTLETTNTSSADLCPTTLGELINRDPHCARIIQRDGLLAQIKEYFTQIPEPKPNHIVLYGQPMVGKTKMLNRLSEALGSEFIPLLVTGQGLNATDNLDVFTFDLTDQLTNRFKLWTKNQKVPMNLNNPNWSKFDNGKGPRAFYKHWNNLQLIAGQTQPIVIFDEIEHLLDNPQKLNLEILTFLDGFVGNPEHGHFILAGSEYIRRSENEQFSLLIARGHPIQVPHYSDETVVLILSAIEDYFTIDDDVLQYCVALCDGHPRILQIMFEAVVYEVTKSPGKQRLQKKDIEPISTKVIERAEDVLWALLQRLSFNEKAILRLTSQKTSNLINEFEYSLHELVDLADQYFVKSKIDYERLSKGAALLAEREWLEWTNRASGLFRFKLGIFPLWLHRNHISLDEERG